MTDLADDDVMLQAEGLAKSFVLHNQGGVRIAVLAGLDLEVRRGECLILAGPSGAGQPSLLRPLSATYKPQAGTVRGRPGDRVVALFAPDPEGLLVFPLQLHGFVIHFLALTTRVAH